VRFGSDADTDSSASARAKAYADNARVTMLHLHSGQNPLVGGRRTAALERGLPIFQQTVLRLYLWFDGIFHKWCPGRPWRHSGRPACCACPGHRRPDNWVSTW